ncbi:MAG TPA: hypothetical protein VFW44_20690 [Bryobacteraceae bacterium]|nr:hypothetical protein [Bryobacteraceae bacterium]
MAINELSTISQVGSWRIPEFPAAIEYPLETMDQIRAYACDELLQLSHAGNEVGGVLFGTHSDELIRIVTWRPIASEHAQGEALALSFNDRMNLAVQLELARQNADLKDLRPVGCFISHLRDGVCLRATDLELFNGFFPATWEVALVISPQGEGRAEAGFFVREMNEKLQAKSSHRVFQLQPSEAALAVRSQQPAPRPAAPPQFPLQPSHPPQAQPPSIPAAALRSGLPTGLRPGPGTAQTSEPNFPAAPVPQRPAPVEFALPSFQTEERIPTKERWMWGIPILLALGIAAFVLYQQRGPSGNGIGLRVSNQDQTIQITWDANTRAVREAFRGEITVDDGGKQSEIALSSDQLHSGKMSYQAQSGDVGFQMTVYPPNGDPLHDSTRLVVAGARSQPPQLLQQGQAESKTPPATTPVPPPQTVAPVNPATATPPTAPPPTLSPAPAVTTPSADQAALEKQVQDLKASVARERARADELQNLVRILENRLALQPSPSARPQGR